MSEVNHEGANFSNLAAWRYNGDLVRFAADTGLGGAPIMLMVENCHGDIEGWTVAYDDDELEYFPAPAPVVAMLHVEGASVQCYTPKGEKISTLHWLQDGEYELREKVS